MMQPNMMNNIQNKKKQSIINWRPLITSVISSSTLKATEQQQVHPRVTIINQPINQTQLQCIQQIPPTIYLNHPNQQQQQQQQQQQHQQQLILINNNI
jgi:hypothetical protein